jgi:GNAT superfamily N-acetyltransferase
VRPFHFRAVAYSGGMTQALTLRHATLADLSAVDDLLRRSYPKLLAKDYPPSVMVLAVPLFTRARPELLTSGRYHLALSESGRVVGAGGWSGRGQGLAQVRHVATDPGHLRRGIGRALMGRVMAEAGAAGFAVLDCLATRTAVPFYASLGFENLGPVEIGLAPGISFPAVRMLHRIK